MLNQTPNLVPIMLQNITQISKLKEGEPVVYIIVDGEEFFKVGCTTNLKDRLRNIAQGNARVLRLHSLFYGDQYDEEALHMQLGDLFVGHGEWFTYDARRLHELNRKPLNLPLSLAYKAFWTPYAIKESTPPRPLKEELEAILSNHEGETIATKELKEALLSHTGKHSQRDIKKVMTELGWKALGGKYARNGWVPPMQRWGEQSWTGGE